VAVWPAAIRISSDPISLFLIDDILEDNVGQPDHERPKPRIFLK
jgi:hypothetical protein